MSQALSWGILAACFLTGLSAPALGDFLDEADLRHLGAGTVLTTQRPIPIPANATQARISSGSSSMECFVRMSHARPFARVIPGGRRLTVTGTERSALSAPGRIFPSTRIQVQSESVDDILCATRRGNEEPRVREFRRAVSGLMSVEIPDTAVEVG